MSHRDVAVFTWRGSFSNAEVHALHAEASETWLHDESEWNWVEPCERHSLVAREGGRLVGFLNVLWDGLVHAYLEHVMVAVDSRHRGIGTGLVDTARAEAHRAGCDFLHVGFGEDHRPFYIDACGLTPVPGGIIELS